MPRQFERVQHKLAALYMAKWCKRKPKPLPPLGWGGPSRAHAGGWGSDAFADTKATKDKSTCWHITMHREQLYESLLLPGRISQDHH